MGKHNPKGTKLLYRKSNCTFQTQSKTYSSASQFFTRSAVKLLKNKQLKNIYYMDNGKLKRDLSVETDVCILRGYWMRKFNRHIYSLSKCVTTPDKSKPDLNSCGDSIPEEHDAKRINIDVTSLVVNNLKDLLNDWIKKHLLDNNETKQKIETVFDSILHKLQRHSSCCTYTLGIKVDEEQSKLITRGKQSSQTVPVMGKQVRLISTLSIPRKIKRHNYSAKLEHQNQTMRKIRYKNVFLTVSRSSTFLLNSSSFNLLSISTKSFIKRCATYDGKEVKTSGRKHEVVLLPKSSHSKAIPDATRLRARTEKVKLDLVNKIYPNELEIEPVQSLVKSIYADDPANVTSTEVDLNKKCKHDNYTMTDTDSAPKHVKSRCKLNWNKAKFSSEPQNMIIHNTTKGVVKVETKSTTYAKLKTVPHRHKMRKTISKNDKKKKHWANLQKVPNSKPKENNLAIDLQSILNYFSSYADDKNIKLDIKINVFPGLPNKALDQTEKEQRENDTFHTDNAYNIISTQLLSETKTYNDNIANISRSSEPKFISLLDSAASQSKYVISKETSSKIIDGNIKKSNVTIGPNNITPCLEIAKDISELRGIIKDLAITTDTFVKEHLKYNKTSKAKGIYKEKGSSSATGTKGDSKTLSLSKAVQFSNGEYKSQIMSGLKLKKEPKKKHMQELNTRLTKKSISYNVIESESILNITDMTSAAAEMSKSILIDKPLDCCLPKAKSQCEITVGQSKRKLLAYFCDELIKSRQFTQNRNPVCICSSNDCKYKGCTNEDPARLINEISSNKDNEKYHNEIACGQPQQHSPFHEDDCEIGGPGESCSSIYVDVKDRKKFTVRSRSGMTFWEGLIYCILLWIPVVVILWLIYVYVIRDVIEPKNPTIGRTALPSQRPGNSSFLRISLSDLGF